MAISILPFFVLPVYAADYSISAGNTTIEVGGSTTVTVSISGLTGKVDVTGGASDSFWSDGTASKSYTVTGNAVGTISVSVTVDNISDNNGDLYSGTKTVTINVVAPTPTDGGSNGGSGNSGGETQTPTTQTPTEKKSSDANLSALSISSGTLAPEFSADITDYKVALPKDTTSISVEAVASDSKASVSGTGEHALEAGDNELKVSVTAEDGTVKNYIIIASVDETPDVFVTYNEKKLGIVKNLSDVTPPDTFEETTVSFEGKEVKGWKSNLRGLTLLYLIDEANEKNFYIYDTDKGVITSIYKPMALLGRNIAIIDIPSELQTRTGMRFGEVEVDKQKLQGWTFDDDAFANYILVYLMDDQGKTNYYLYEKSENTLQLYSGQAAVSQIDYEQNLSEQETALMQRMYMIIALLVTNVITVMLLLVVLMKKKQKKGRTHNNTKELKKPLIQDEEIEFANASVTIHDNTNHKREHADDTTLHLEPFSDGLEDTSLDDK